MANNNATNTATPVVVSSGGTGLGTLTAHSVQVGNGTGTLTQIPVGATGTVFIGTTGADPSFSATPTVTSIVLGSGSTLATYVEGTFTPTFDGSVSGSTTYTSQNGYYTQIGNLVYAQGSIVITAATGTGNATIGGLPFTIKNQTNGNVEAVINFNGSGWAWPASRTSMTGSGSINTKTILLVVGGTSIAPADLQMTNAAATITFSVTYQV